MVSQPCEIFRSEKPTLFSFRLVCMYFMRCSVQNFVDFSLSFYIERGFLQTSLNWVGFKKSFLTYFTFIKKKLNCDILSSPGRGIILIFRYKISYFRTRLCLYSVYCLCSIIKEALALKLQSRSYYILFKQNISFEILPDVLYNPCILLPKIFNYLNQDQSEIRCTYFYPTTYQLLRFINFTKVRLTVSGV